MERNWEVSGNSLRSDNLEVELLAPDQDLHNGLIASSEFSVERYFARVLTALQANQNPEIELITT